MSGDRGNAFVGIPVVDCRIRARHSCVLDFPGHFHLDLVVFDSNARLDRAGRDPSLPYRALRSCGVHFVGETALAVVRSLSLESTVRERCWSSSLNL